MKGKIEGEAFSVNWSYGRVNDVKGVGFRASGLSVKKGLGMWWALRVDSGCKLQVRLSASAQSAAGRNPAKDSFSMTLR